MSATVWRCECGAKYELPEASLGRKVRCGRCGVVTRAEKPTTIEPPTSHAPLFTVDWPIGGLSLPSTQWQPGSVEQLSKKETERNSERGNALLDGKETIFWVRIVNDDKVVYTYRNYKIFYFCILPLLILFMVVPVIGLIPILGWIFYWAIYPRPNREITQLLKVAQCGVTGSKLSAVNPMRLTFSRADFDRIVTGRVCATNATTQSSSAPTLPNTHSDGRSSDAEFESLKKKNEELKRKVEAKKLAEKQARDRAALEADNARLMAELGEGRDIHSAETSSGRKRP